MREKFSELARAEPHLGLDPQAPSLEDPSSTLENERFALGRKVLAANHAPMSQEFLKKGLLFWRKLFGILENDFMGDPANSVKQPRETFILTGV